MQKASRFSYVLLVLSIIAGHSSFTRAQALPDAPAERPYSFRRSWSIFSEYSPDSSPIFLGIARERKFFNIGGAFTQRLFVTRTAALFYIAEMRPLMLESDPVVVGFRFTLSGPEIYYTNIDRLPRRTPVLDPRPISLVEHGILDGVPVTITSEVVYDRRWTYAFGFSPLGFQANFLPRSRIQPVLTGLGGFAVSPRDIPMFDSSAFNFTFSIGAGVEFYRTAHHASRLEYRIQHLSSANIGATNSGIDSQMIRASFTWGR